MAGAKGFYSTQQDRWGHWGVTCPDNGERSYGLVQGGARACSRNQQAWGMGTDLSDSL